MIRVISYRAGASTVVHSDEKTIESLLADPEVVLWIDVASQTPQPEEQKLLECLGLHSLVIEDIFSDAPLPKIEEFENYLYIVVHGIDRRADGPEQLNTIELDLVTSKRWVLTHHSHSMRTIEAVEAELSRSPRILQKGTTFLAHALLDHLTDHYLPLMDRFDDEIEELETAILANAEPHHLERLFDLKRSLQRIRRVSIHQKEIMQKLSRGEFDQIEESSLPFFRDVYDHFVRISDLTDAYRELVNATLDMYLSMQSQKMNEIMKVLTLISTIMLPLTFIAGVYGMNFKVMPELDWPMGYPFALILMVLVAGAFVWYFKRKKWL